MSDEAQDLRIGLLPFGEAFREIRLAAGVSASQVAKCYVKQDGATGCDVSYINAVEAGKYRRLSRETERKLNKALKTAIHAKEDAANPLLEPTMASPRESGYGRVLQGPGFRTDAQNMKQDFQGVMRSKQQPTQPIPSKRLDIEAVLTGATFSFSLAALLALLYILLEGI